MERDCGDQEVGPAPDEARSAVSMDGGRSAHETGLFHGLKLHWRWRWKKDSLEWSDGFCLSVASRVVRRVSLARFRRDLQLRLRNTLSWKLSLRNSHLAIELNVSNADLHTKTQFGIILPLQMRQVAPSSSLDIGWKYYTAGTKGMKEVEGERGIPETIIA